MRPLLSRLLPRTLSSRLIVVAALSLFIGQAISFTLLLREQQRQWVTFTATPAVLRIIERTDPAANPRPNTWFGRVETGSQPPEPSGREVPDIADRAAEMLSNAGLPTLRVIAHIDHGPLPRARLARIIAPDRPPPRNRARLRLAVQLAPSQWLIVSTPVRESAPPIARRLVAQTILIYAAILFPLLWMGRRLSRPLGALTAAARDFKPGSSASPLAETGPGDIRDLTRAFNGMRGRIAAMLAEKDHMLGAIGHDLRTPLAALRVRAESVPDPEDRQQMVVTIEQMNQMLEDILALARVGRDRQPPQKIDLGALAEAVTDDFTATGADVDFVEGERAIVVAHTPAIRRAIANLIDNAVTYGHRARVSVRTGEGRAILTVEDDGPGIDPEKVDAMLEPFTRLEQSRSRETGGAGLGLALVRAVMRAEWGEVHLRNRSDGQGLIAELDLPLADR
jgi:signal transduction histidine kinase